MTSDLWLWAGPYLPLWVGPYLPLWAVDVDVDYHPSVNVSSVTNRGRCCEDSGITVKYEFNFLDMRSTALCLCFLFLSVVNSQVVRAALGYGSRPTRWQCNFADEDD